MRILKREVLVTTLIALGLVSSAACGHKRVKYNPGEAVTQNEAGGLEAEMVWVKNKGDSIDARMILRNNYKEAVSFANGSFKMSFEGVPGRLKKVEFTGEMPAGATEEGLVIFEFKPKIGQTGKAILELSPIHKGDDEAKRKKVPALKIEFNASK